jgi:hypothetical protein
MEHVMDTTMRTGRRHFLAQGGVAALAGIALQSAFASSASGQDATPAAAGTPITAAPGADCAGQEHAEQNLASFDRLDFEGWNKRDWDVFSELHADQVKVAGFGTQSEGLEAHVAWAKAFIEQNPESMIMAHPIRIGAGDWTAVTGLLNDGSTMATIAHWENGKISEEYLFSLSTGG